MGFESVMTISLSAESLALIERLERLCAEMKSLGLTMPDAVSPTVSVSPWASPTWCDVAVGDVKFTKPAAMFDQNVSINTGIPLPTELKHDFEFIFDTGDKTREE